MTKLSTVILCNKNEQQNPRHPNNEKRVILFRLSDLRATSKRRLLNGFMATVPDLFSFSILVVSVVLERLIPFYSVVSFRLTSADDVKELNRIITNVPGISFIKSLGVLT